MTESRALHIAAQWNNGPGTAIYAFVATGEIDHQPYHNALRETYEMVKAHRRNTDLLDLYVFFHNNGPRRPIQGWSEQPA